MTLVRLVVTGALEQAALAQALGRAFPTTQFEPLGGMVGVGFTSREVRHFEEGPVANDVMKYAAYIVAEVENPGTLRKKRADHVIAVEDLELVNAGHAGQVVQALRAAIVGHVRATYPNLKKQERVFEALRQRASFHLAVPMTESWFFGEPAALVRAGQLPGRSSLFDRATRDPEDFEVEDPTYAGVPPSDLKREWPHNPALRSKHPKKYISFLGDKNLDALTAYKESTTGAAALRDLDWLQVLSRAEQYPFLRAILADLEDAIGEGATGFTFTKPTCATWPPPRENVLRNC